MRFISLLFFFQIICILNSYARTITVRWSDIPDTIVNLEENDSLIVRNGVYRKEPIVLRSNFKRKVYIIAEEKGKVVLSDRSSVVFKKASNIVLEGFLFESMPGISVILDQSHNIEIRDNLFLKCGSHPGSSILRIQNGSGSNLIVNNTFDGSMAQSISIITRENNKNDILNINNKIISNCFRNIPAVRSIYPQSTGNGMEAIMVGYGTSITMKYKLFTIIENNLFENIIGDNFEIISNKTSNNYIIGNFFINNIAGLTLRTGDYITIKGNVFCNTSKGIRVYGYGHLIENNYFYASDIGVYIPNGDYKKNEAHTRIGYSQAENIQVVDNSFQNVNREIVVGDRLRKLKPIDIEVKNNIRKKYGEMKTGCSRYLLFKEIGHSW